ncbi:MAG: HAMP domain-containing sensor histidine kinase [Thermaerobacter sp.]|nr:HAMP domain-containing sensor histidine kinase [Thermaerobacter sp.]
MGHEHESAHRARWLGLMPWALGVSVAVAGAVWWQTASRAAAANGLAYLQSQQALAFFRAGDAARARGLLASAARALGLADPVPSTPAAARRMAALAVAHLAAGAPSTGAVGLAVALGALIALGGVVWRYQRALEREQARRRAWERQWADEARLAGAALSDPAGIKVVLAQVLDGTVTALNLDEALLLRWQRERPLDALGLYAFSGRAPGREWTAVPGAYLAEGCTGAGRALVTGTPWHRGGGASAPLLPAYNPPGALVYPIVVGGSVWGLLVLAGRSATTPVVGGDLVERARRQVETLLTHLATRAASDRDRAYQEAARLQSELLGHVSHELRTPMGLIRGYARTLLREGNRLSAEDQTEFLTVIAEETERLAGLVDRLLKMAALEGGEAAPAFRSVDMAQLAAAAVNRLAPAERGRVEMHMAPALQAHGDREGLLEVVSNLVDNAIKYSSGVVDVSGTVRDGMLVLTVRDRGPGVSEAELPRLFDRFYRGQAARRQPTVRGTGLGLGIARRIVENHEGRITVSNASGGGLVVEVQLPVMAQRNLGVSR